MKKRVVTGLIIFLVVALTISAKFLPLTIGNYIFDVFVLGIAIISSIEMSNILTKSGKENNVYVISIFPIFMYSVLLFTQYMVSIGWLLLIELLSFILYFVVVLTVESLANKNASPKENFKFMLNNLCGFIYPGILMVLLLNLNHIDYFAKEQFSTVFILLAFLVSMLTDTFAYFIGCSLRGPKLAPKISPNKTISGAIGGLIGGAVAGVLVYFLGGLIPSLNNVFSAYNIMWWQFMLIGLGGAIVGQAGDLLESKFKRMADIKDSGNIFPGHGGMLDRVDNLMTNTAYLFVVALIIIL